MAHTTAAPEDHYKADLCFTQPTKHINYSSGVMACATGMRKIRFNGQAEVSGAGDLTGV